MHHAWMKMLGFNENSLSGLDSPLGLDESSLLALDEDENSPPGLDEILTQIRCQVDIMVPVDHDPNPVIIPLDSPPCLDEMLTQFFQLTY